MQKQLPLQCSQANVLTIIAKDFFTYADEVVYKKFPYAFKKIEIHRHTDQKTR